MLGHILLKLLFWTSYVTLGIERFVCFGDNVLLRCLGFDSGSCQPFHFSLFSLSLIPSFPSLAANPGPFPFGFSFAHMESMGTLIFT